MEIKYLMMDNLGMYGTNNGYILFPAIEDHCNMARKLGGKEHVIGAGFIQFDEVADGSNCQFPGTVIQAHCYGRSVSLNIGVGKNDSEMITMLINN